MLHQRYGIVGQGISHSLSPIIHAVSAKHLGLDISYEIFQPSEASLLGLIEGFFLTGGQGLNITTPFKTVVAASSTPADFSSVNTLFRVGEELRATSTDGRGFVDGLRRMGRQLADFKRIFFLGDGGAVVGLIEYFLKLECTAEISVFRRGDSRDGGLLALFPFLQERIFPLTAVCLAEQLGARVHTRDDLIIQGTRAPLAGDSLAYLLPALASYQGAMVDLVYQNPSAIFRQVKAKGNDCQDGLPMLIEQARHSQYLWWQQAAPYELIEHHLSGVY